MTHFKKTVLLSGIFIALFFNACGDASNPYAPDFSVAPDPFSLEGAEKVETGTGLVYYVIEEGSGESIDRRSSVYLFYTGRTMDGEIFDSSYDRGKITSTLFSDIGGLIDGFQEGLIGMKAGGKRVLIIPPELGYGDRESHQLQNDTLRFDIEVDKIQY